MNYYLNQYRIFFIILWVLSYIVYPSWALPLPEITRHLIVAGVLIYFATSLFFLHRWLYSLSPDKPFIAPIENLRHLIKSHSGLAAVCLIAAILHVYPVVMRPIMMIGDEALHLQGGLWVYNFTDSSSHIYFQVVFWILIGIIVFVKTWEKLWKCVVENYRKYLSSNKSTTYIIISIFCIAIIYYYFFQNWQYYPDMIRYPPLSRLIYLVLYSAFGIDHLWPRIFQVALYLLGAIYLYRTILLFSSRNAALFGAAIYLFHPITFIYSTVAYLSGGTVFFVILVSFYFLRFLENKDNRDIILVSFFIGAGFLYKRGTFLMVFICALYLIYCWLRNKDVHIFIFLKGMVLAMVPIIPWMLIGKYFTWRNFQLNLSNFIPPEGKIYTYLTKMPFDISWVIFVLFMVSIVFILKRKQDNLSHFFIFLFASYYFLFAIDMGGQSPRLAIIFNPTISVFVALLLSHITDKVRMKHAFMITFVCLLTYLISICTVPSLNATYMKHIEMKKFHQYPSEKAMNWVRDNVKDGEKIVTLRIMTALFYRDKYEIDKSKIIDFWYSLEDVSTPEKLKKHCVENEISYIMFPYGLVYDDYFPILQYLKDDDKDEFVKVAEFNIDDNFIYVYKFR